MWLCLTSSRLVILAMRLPSRFIRDAVCGADSFTASIVAETTEKALNHQCIEIGTTLENSKSIVFKTLAG